MPDLFEPGLLATLTYEWFKNQAWVVERYDTYIEELNSSVPEVALLQGINQWIACCKNCRICVAWVYGSDKLAYLRPFNTPQGSCDSVVDMARPEFFEQIADTLRKHDCSWLTKYMRPIDLVAILEKWVRGHYGRIGWRILPGWDIDIHSGMIYYNNSSKSKSFLQATPKECIQVKNDGVTGLYQHMSCALNHPCVDINIADPQFFKKLRLMMEEIERNCLCP